jgi:hypothetical protein
MARFSGSGLDAGDAHGRVVAVMAALQWLRFFNPAILWLMVQLGDGESDPSDRRLGPAI